MKKGLTYILTFILSFICMIGVLKASTVEKTCTYRLYSENDRSSDAYYDFDIIYKLVDNKDWSVYFNTSDGKNQSVLIYNNGSTNDRIEVIPYNGITSNMHYIYADVEKQSNNFGFFYAEKSGLVSKDSSGNYSFNSCLPIYYRETLGLTGDNAYFSVTVNNILDAYLGQYDVANPIDKRTGESLIEDPDKDYKKCHLQIKESDAYCDSNLISNDRIITLDINTSPVGEIKIYLNDKIMTEKDGGLYLQLVNGTGVNLKRYNFIITAEELANIKKIYKYTTNADSSTCASLYFSILKRNVNDVYISTTKSSNACSGEASVNVTLNPDKKGDKNNSGTGEIDNSLGTCVLLLGSASDDNTVANFLYKIFQIMKIVSIVIVIVMCMLDLAKTITTNKDDLMPIVKKCGKRLILLFVLLFLPTIIDLAGNIVGKEDILCGIK